MARRLLAFTVVAATACSGASALARADPLSTSRRINDDHPLGGFVRGALQGAQQRMARPKCQQLLFDFTDASGRSLRENLDVVGGAPDAFLGMLLFYDGSEHSRCGNPRVLAFTSPGNRAIFICRAQFMKKRESRPLVAELVLIHEALHSLGLAENPPSSSEINQQVRARCGS